MAKPPAQPNTTGSPTNPVTGRSYAFKLRMVWSRLQFFVRNKMLLLLIGGALGTYLRYLLGKWFNEQPWGQSFPFGTLFINVLGSFLLGFTAIIVFEKLPPEHQFWYLFIGTGFCGGFTTFSTFEWETYKLMRDGSYWYAFANVAGSVVAGFVAVILGVLLASALFIRK